MLNKVDIDGTQTIAEKLRLALEPLNPDVWIISAITGEGLEKLKRHLSKLVIKTRESDAEASESAETET